MDRLILLLWPLALVSFIVDVEWVSFAIAALFAIYVAGSLVRARHSDKVFGAAMIGASATLMALDGNLYGLPGVFAQTVVFAAFVASAQMLRGVSERDPRVDRYRTALTLQSDPARPVWMMVGSSVLGCVMTVGAVAILAPLFAGAEDAGQRRVDAVATLSGTALAVNWSPFFVSIAVVSAFFPQLPLWSLMAVGLTLSVVGMVIALLTLSTEHPIATAGRALNALGGFIPIILVAGLAVTVLRKLGDFSTLQASCLALPPLCVILILTGQGRRDGFAQLRDVGRATLGRILTIGPDTSVVALAFMFGLVLRDSATVDASVSHLGLAVLPAPLLLAMVPLSMMLLGVLSVHPIVSASLLMSLLADNHGAVSDLALAGATLVGWSAAAMVSYSGLLLMVTASVSAVPRGELILSRNLFVAPLYAITSALLLAALNRTIS